MKTQAKKMLALLLAVVMVFAMAACGANEAPPAAEAAPAATQAAAPAEGSSAAESNTVFAEPVEISLFTCSTPSYAFKADWYVLDLIKEYTNVDLDVQAVEQEAFNDKFTLLMAGGELPDIVMRYGVADANIYGPQGAFINVLDYMDQMPNFKAFYESRKEELGSYINTDGGMYAFPFGGNEPTNRQGWMYRKDVFETLGLSVPTTEEEFYNVLVALKEAYPDSYPLAFRENAGGLWNFRAMVANYGISWRYNKNAQTGSYELGYITDNMKEMVTFYNKLYNEGLLSPSWLTMDTAGWEEAMTTDQAFVTMDYLGRIDSLTKAGKGANSDFQMAGFVMPAGGTNGVTAAPYPFGIKNALSVSALLDEAHLNEVLKYIDWMYSDEAIDVLTWGRPGELYTEDANGKRTWNTFTSIQEVRSETGLQTEGMYTFVTFDGESSTFSEELQAAHALHDEYELNVEPAMIQTEEEQKIDATIGNAIFDHCNQEISKFLLGQRSIDEWDAYVAEVEALGAAEYLAMVETVLARQGG